MPIGISPEVTRSAAGPKDSTSVGFIAAEVANEFVRFLFADEFVQVDQPLRRRRVQGRIGHNQLAAVLRLDQIFQGFGRVCGIDDALVVDDADDVVARPRSQVGVDGVLRKVSIHRRIVLRENAFLEHDAHGVFGGHDQIEERFAGARLAERALHDFGRRRPPVVDGDTGLLVKGLLQQFENIRLHGAVNHQLAVLFGGFDLFGVLREGGRRTQQQVKEAIISLQKRSTGAALFGPSPSPASGKGNKRVRSDKTLWRCRREFFALRASDSSGRSSSSGMSFRNSP